MKNTDYRVFVHTPAEQAADFVAWAERIKDDPGIPFGIPAVDRIVIPIRMSDLVCLIARPGHGKTSLLAYFARTHAQRLINAGEEKKKAIVYITWEQCAEELEAFFQTSDKYSISDIAWGAADLEDVRRQAVKRASLPIWVIGHSMSRAGQKMPRMTTEVVLNSIRTMQDDFGVEPVLMLFDYMQLIPVARARDRVQQVTEVPHLVKELSLQIGAPAIVGVQAGREVDKRKIKIPEMIDAQWASSIEQVSDKVLGLWRPWQTEPEGTPPIEIGDRAYIINQELLIMRLLKQRGGIGRYTWPLYFKPEYLRLAEIETRFEEPEDVPFD